MSEEQEGQAQPNPQPGQPTNRGFNQGNPFQPQGSGFGFGGMQQALPNATAVLVLGILSIVTCCCYGVIGLILGIIALVLAKKDKALYNANPSVYTEGSFKNLNAGRICAIIGLVLNIIYLLIYIALIAMFGFGILTDQDAVKDLLMEMQNR
jgi:hypothetical protein